MSLKKNFGYSTILTISNYIFPLITFPYVSRILGVTNIGICNFVDSIVNYYILFSMMGISTIGIREVAKNFNSPLELNKTFTSLFLLNSISTIFALIIFAVSIITIPQLSQYKEIMYISGVKIFFNLFIIEWFYKGIEDFKYITARNLIIRVIYVVSVFAFVHQKGDYIIYYAISVGMVVLNGIINWSYKKTFVKFILKDISFSPYTKPFFISGLYFLLTSMYLSFNVAYLGFVSGKEEVGFYTTATKLYGIFLAIFTAFTGVMMPRMSSLVANGEVNKMMNLTQKSFEILYSFCVPLIIILIMLTPEIITIIAGKGYEGAIVPMRIITPLLLVVGIAQIIVFQILMPLKKDKIILINSIIGAIVGLSMNIIFVKYLQSIGSAISMVVAEITVLSSASYFVYKELQVSVPIKKLFKNVFYSIPYIFICYISKFYNFSAIITCLIVFLTSLIYFILSQMFLLKNEFIREIIKEEIMRKGKIVLTNIKSYQ